MTVLVGARSAFSQDAAGSAAGADASRGGAPTAPVGDAVSAENVLEIPQTACVNYGGSISCAGGSDWDADDGGATIDALWPGATAYVLMSSPLTQAARPPLSPGAGMVSPASANMAMSSPLTPAPRPPLNPGPWMLSPSMSPFSHPAGSPMAGMAMVHPSSGLHH